MHATQLVRAFIKSAVIASSLSIATLSCAMTEADATQPVKPKVSHKRHATSKSTTDHAEASGKQNGNASFYAKRFSGRKTASGEKYDPNALTAAHRTLPLGTQVKVVNPKNDKSVVVTVNDRGPVPRNRMIDVSSAAADALGMKKAGVTKVQTQVVHKDEVGSDPAKGGATAATKDDAKR
jgi:rare lipoprotein A